MITFGTIYYDAGDIQIAHMNFSQVVFTAIKSCIACYSTGK